MSGLAWGIVGVGVLLFGVGGVWALCACQLAAAADEGMELCTCGHTRRMHGYGGDCQIATCRCFIYDGAPVAS